MASNEFEQRAIDPRQKNYYELKKVGKHWIIKAGGKIKHLQFANNAREVYLDENIIAVDDIFFEIKEDSSGDIFTERISPLVCQPGLDDKKQTKAVNQTEKYEIKQDIFDMGSGDLHKGNDEYDSLEAGQTEVDSIIERCNINAAKELPVKPTRVTMATAGIAQSPCSWSIDDLCKIAVYNGNPEHTDAKVILECFLTDRKHVELKSDKVAGKLRVMLPVLPRGQTQSREMLQETFTIFMSGYVKKELNFITIPIDNLKTWTQSLFCETILESFLYWKEVRRPSYIVKLTICALGSYSFDEAVKVCNKVIAGTHKKSISNKDSRYHSLSVHIVEGSLDKMKADALACTVSSNMDLLRGAVSEALLKRGGIKLQEDLDAKSHGRLPFGDIVAVPGHKLDCTHVLFGVMYPFSKKYAKGFRSLEQYYRSSVHEFVQKCLNLAEEKKLRTIAFPAVGAGNLQYPIDVVADQMFKTVINWSGVYVEKVAFVIYQSDKDVLKEFQLAEKQHEQKLEVKVRPFDLAKLCGIEGKMTLLVGNNDLAFEDPKIKRVKYIFPLGWIRRFGVQESKLFYIEAGRILHLFSGKK